LESVLDSSDNHSVTREPVSYASCGRCGGLCFERGEAVDSTAGACDLVGMRREDGG